mgnify:CR=1 FL=1
MSPRKKLGRSAAKWIEYGLRTKNGLTAARPAFSTPDAWLAASSQQPASQQPAASSSPPAPCNAVLKATPMHATSGIQDSRHVIHAIQP